ncbi:MAG: UvrB/UvrC motif-containing protein [Candidatus Marinimicrobia bacterium]|nr:UvrB/UvrC motif-containing protein [Candidatus Neomarinimicrobiota bacterium]
MDIGKILTDWPFEPLVVTARFIEGDDGLKKIQMRIDLGVIQMEYAGRPDGLLPMGFESYLHYYRSLSGSEADFFLTNRQLFDLRQEGLQYYHRYLSLHQLKDYQGVIRDTRHNLDILNLIANHTSTMENFASQQLRPYVMMMNTSAKIMLKLEGDDKSEALRILNAGIRQIKHVYESILEDPQPDLSPEIYQLKELQHRITDDGIPSELPAMEKLEIELQMALLSENYEKAASLRDQIKQSLK